MSAEDDEMLEQKLTIDDLSDDAPVSADQDKLLSKF
jgi:hypothetical protein